MLVDGRAVEPVEAFIDGVLEHCGLADAQIDNGRRYLALAEAGDIDVLGDVAISMGDAGLQLLRGHRDGELGARGAQLFDRGLQVETLLCLDGVQG